MWFTKRWQFMSNVKCGSTVPTDNENKLAWCKRGEFLEGEFIELMNKNTHLKVALNPAKHRDRHVPDLIIEGYGLCDLKSVGTPFFSCKGKGFDPFYTITLNTKDIYRYRSKYPGLTILFWVTWPDGITYKKSAPQPYKWAVYSISMDEILRIVDSGYTSYHAYENRQEFLTKPEMQEKGMDDRGNALGSYFIDVRWMEPVASSITPPKLAHLT